MPHVQALSWRGSVATAQSMARKRTIKEKENQVLVLKLSLWDFY